jgi:hypothetical protein
MNAERSLAEWARRFQGGTGGPQQLREKLERTLAPMIHCAIKTGLGQPTLLRWVRDELPLLADEQRRDPARLAGPLASRLAERLMARLDPLHQRETVPGR